ncbi:MAG: class I SAM-dependent methyltransferase [Candidatus Diapherotrites archaeon]|nr:class I SAM-dependent methyltransferase [Candidatus Diapherotrites archaeon]
MESPNLDKTLEIFENTEKFTNLIYQEIKPFLQGNILEIGSGIGSYSKKIAKDFPQNQILLSEIDPKYIQTLKALFKTKPNINRIKLDLNSEKDFQMLSNQFDSAFALNVLEHVEDDLSALHNVYSVLKKNGTFILLVPCHKFLFNTLDQAVGHYRRYTKKDLIEKIHKTDFKIEKIFHTNVPGIIGWYITGNILKKHSLNKKAMKLFDQLVPFFQILEKHIFRKKIGLSMIVILKKQ